MFEVLVYSGLAGTATCIGVLLVMYYRGFKRYTVYFISFAVGILLGASFLELMPEAIKYTPLYAHLTMLIGFLLFYLLENVVIFHSCSEADCKLHRLGWMSFFGLFLHSLIDGVAIGAGFEISHSLGTATALAVIFHKLPAGIITTSLLLKANFKRRATFFYSLMVALATPLGAVLTKSIAYRFTETTMGIMLALVAGSFIYIAAADLIPLTHDEHNILNIAQVFFGVAVILGVEMLFG